MHYYYYYYNYPAILRHALWDKELWVNQKGVHIITDLAPGDSQRSAQYGVKFCALINE